MEKRNVTPAPKQMFNPMPEYIGDTGNGNTVNMRGTIAQNQNISAQNSIPPTPPNMKERAEIENEVNSTINRRMIDEEIMNEQIKQDIDDIASTSKFNPPQSPKDVLKSIIAKGSYSEDVEIMDNTWTMKALSQRDILAAFNEVREENESIMGRVNAMSFAQIIYSIEAVNGIPLQEWFPEIDRSKFFTTEAYELAIRRALMRYFERMPNRVINIFIEKYNKIEEKRNEAIAELKNS